MRIVLLLVGLLTLGYISYYLFFYSFDPARQKPRSMKVEFSGGTKKPAEPTPEAVVADTSPRPSLTSPKPLESESDRLLRLIQARTDRDLEQGLEAFLTHPPTEKKVEIEQALKASYGRGLVAALEPYTNEANFPPEIIRRSLQLALAEGGTDACQLVQRKLASQEAAVHEAAVSAIQQADLASLDLNGIRLLFEGLQAQEELDLESFKAMHRVVARATESEKQEWIQMSADWIRRLSLAGEETQFQTSQAVLKELVSAAQADNSLVELMRERFTPLSQVRGVSAFLATLKKNSIQHKSANRAETPAQTGEETHAEEAEKPLNEAAPEPSENGGEEVEEGSAEQP